MYHGVNPQINLNFKPETRARDCISTIQCDHAKQLDMGSGNPYIVSSSYAPKTALYPGRTVLPNIWEEEEEEEEEESLFIVVSTGGSPPKRAPESECTCRHCARVPGKQRRQNGARQAKNLNEVRVTIGPVTGWRGNGG